MIDRDGDQSNDDYDDATNDNAGTDDKTTMAITMTTTTMTITIMLMVTIGPVAPPARMLGQRLLDLRCMR